MLRRFVGWFCPECRFALSAGKGKRPADWWCYDGHEQVAMEPLFVDNATGLLMPARRADVPKEESSASG